MPDQPIETPNIAPNIDAELDAALGKSFAGVVDTPIVENNDKPNVVEPPAVPKVQPEAKQDKPELKAEKVEKPVEEKPLPTQEEIEKINEKDKGAWGAIKNANKRAHLMIEQKDAENAKLKSLLAEKESLTKKEFEALKAENEENKKFRAMIELEADPEFINNFDQPINNVVTEIKAFLKERGVSDESIAGMNLNDSKVMSNVIAILDREEGELSASEFRTKIREYLDLSKKRSKTLEDQKKNYKEHLEQRKKEAFAKGSETEGRMLKHLELKTTEKNKDGKPLIPFLNKIEPKENATQAEIDQVKNHNTMVEDLSGKLQSVLKMREPEQQAEIALAAVASHYLMAQLKVTTEELRKAKEELGKIAAVSSETPTRKPNNPTGRNGNSEPIDTDTALNQHFAGRR